MIIIYYLWSLVVDTFLFLRGSVFTVTMLEIPLCRFDIVVWLILLGSTIFAVWWPPLTGQANWSAFAGAISAAAFLAVVLTFKLLSNRNHFFRRGWSESLMNKGKIPLANPNGPIKAEVVVGAGESSTMHAGFTDSSLFLALEHDPSRGLEFPYNETSFEIGMLYRNCVVRPALRLRSKSLGATSAYVFKAEPAALLGLYAFLSPKQQTFRSTSSGKKALAAAALAAGILVTFTFGLWRVTTITHPEPSYPVGIINSTQAALYELPASKSKLISNLKLGEAVTVLQGDKDWYYVLSSSKQAGYVARGFINVPK